MHECFCIPAFLHSFISSFLHFCISASLHLCICAFLHFCASALNVLRCISVFVQLAPSPSCPDRCEAESRVSCLIHDKLLSLVLVVLWLVWFIGFVSCFLHVSNSRELTVAGRPLERCALRLHRRRFVSDAALRLEGGSEVRCS